MFSKLTGQKLDTEDLLSVCLSKGETLATFTSSGNFPFNMLLLITEYLNYLLTIELT